MRVTPCQRADPLISTERYGAKITYDLDLTRTAL